MGCRLALVVGWCLGFPARVLVDVDFLLLQVGGGGWLLGIFVVFGMGLLVTSGFTGLNFGWWI